MFFEFFEFFKSCWYIRKRLSRVFFAPSPFSLLVLLLILLTQVFCSKLSFNDLAEGKNIPPVCELYDQVYNATKFSGEGTKENVYDVCLPEHIGLIGSDEYTLSGHYALFQDIDLNGIEMNQIGGACGEPDAFTGTFEGWGHSLSNYTLAAGQEDNGSLFGCNENVDGVTFEKQEVPEPPEVLEPPEFSFTSNIGSPLPGLGGSGTIDVISNVSWEASTDAATWCTLDIAQGEGDGTVTVTVTVTVEANAGAERSCTVTFTAGGEPQNFVVVQQPPPPPPPLAIIALQVTDRQLTTVTLSWTIPSSGTVAESYETEFKKNNETAWADGPTAGLGISTVTFTNAC